MLKIGLTGGIGSGKSTIANIFRHIGIPVFDADTTAKLLMHTDAGIRQKLIQKFGPDTYRGDELNRAYLSSQVFKDTYKLEQLNAIVHPATIQAAARWFAAQNAPYAIKEAALLFESGTAGGLDYVIGVYCPENIRIQRVMHRDRMSAEQVIERIQNQMDENIKMRLCDFVLVNDGTEMVLPQVLKLNETFISLANEHSTSDVLIQ